MVEFDQTPDVHFFLCRECRTHIALTQELLFTEAVHGGAIFRNTVNVKVENDPGNHRIIGIYTVADARCNRCMELLGLKFVQVSDHHDIFQAGRFLMYLERLLLWDGSKILYADTRCPVEESDSDG